MLNLENFLPQHLHLHASAGENTKEHKENAKENLCAHCSRRGEGWQNGFRCSFQSAYSSWAESVYETCMAFEIRESGLLVATQVALPVVYKDVQMDAGLRLDMLVENCVIVELKSVENTNPIYEAQLLTYLKLTGIRLGFLINFNVVHLKDGIKRMVV